MEQYPPPDWFTPKAKAERAKRRKPNLSQQAADAFDELRDHLAEHPAWLESTTASVMIEFLCWHYHQSRAMGESPGFKGFRPKTKRGRPTSVNFIDNARPATMRKAAGLSIEDVRVGPKPPKL